MLINFFTNSNNLTRNNRFTTDMFETVPKRKKIFSRDISIVFWLFFLFIFILSVTLVGHHNLLHNSDMIMENIDIPSQQIFPA